MIPVTVRRALALVFVVLVASSCAGGDKTYVRVGEESMSRSELIDYTAVISRRGEAAIHPTANLRALAGQWILESARAQVLADDGIVLEDPQLLAAEQLVQQAVAAGDIAPITPSSDAYDDVVRTAWFLQDPGTAVPEDAVDGFEIEVDRSIGVWDPTSRQIIPFG